MIQRAPAVLLFRGRGFISASIRWQTRSPYSHAALLYPDGKTIIEAWQFRGVQKREVIDWEGIEVFEAPNLDAWRWEQIFHFAESKIGKRYDYRGVLRFLSRIPASTDDAWFCSELVFAAFQSAGWNLLHETTAGAVSPAMLALSPLLWKADIPF